MAIFPLSVSANGRYLVDAQGSPFPLWGDAGWSAPHNLSSAEQDQYLADRKARGFTAVLFEAIEHDFTISKPPKDVAGNLPATLRLDAAAYTGSPNGTTQTSGSAQFVSGGFAADPYTTIATQCPDLTNPTAAYWTIIDSYIAKAAALGFAVLLFPGYVGFSGLQEGWMSEMVQLDSVIGAGGQAGQPQANASKSLLWNYGAWIAYRYSAAGASPASNIIWVHGGDYGSGSTSGTFSTAQKNAVDSLMQGIKSVSGTSVLHTAHWSRPSQSTDVVLTSAFDLQAVYVSTNVAQLVRAGYSSGAGPTFMIEDQYEGAAGGSVPYRKYNWWTVMSGAGHFFGHATLWPFNTGWASLLNSTTAQDMARMHAFLRGFPWWRLVPAGIAGMRTIVTANGSSSGSQDYIAAVADPNGTCVLAYVPPAWASGTFTVNMAAINSRVGTARYRWFDPTAGTFTGLTTGVAASGSRVFTPPGTNSAGDTDWVLVIEAEPTLLPSIGVSYGTVNR